MIVTVTLNPAIDKTCRMARMISGQVNRMDSMTSIAGGKGVNVTKILRQYGYEVMALGFLGGYTGRFIEDSLKAMGAECRFTQIAGDTRCNLNVISEDGYVTELLEPGPVISKEELTSFLAEYKRVLDEAELVILSGSIPKGVPENIYQVLIELAKQAGVNVLLDSSGEAMRAGISAKPFMIKPNLKELEGLIGRRITDKEEAAIVAGEFALHGISHVMVSMGAKGLLYAHDNEALFVKAPDVKAVNTVACGDSVVASFAMSLLKGESTEECLKRAGAISAANATTLESAVIPREVAENLYESIDVCKLSV